MVALPEVIVNVASKLKTEVDLTVSVNVPGQGPLAVPDTVNSIGLEQLIVAGAGPVPVRFSPVNVGGVCATAGDAHSIASTQLRSAVRRLLLI